MIRINQIKLPVTSGKKELENKISQLIKTKDFTIETIVKKSLDARKKDNIYYNATATVKLRVNEDKIISRFSNAESFAPYRYNFTATKELNERPIVVGSGPAGLFAALTLAKFGAKPIVI
ncbi:MAG: hypothetical protein IJX12_06175, partial [Lachnospiraceae bacterium]|nr:hypothetical protein [Lachnospiraceae bacterium]